MTGRLLGVPLFSLEGTAFEDQTGLFYALWILATVTYGVGDIVTTTAIRYLSHDVHELNALVTLATAHFGRPGLVGLKLIIFVGFVLGQVYSLHVAREEDWLVVFGPPVLLWLVGLFVTASNSWLLLAP